MIIGWNYQKMPWCNGQDEKIKSFCEGVTPKTKNWLLDADYQLFITGVTPYKMGYTFFEGVTPLVSC